MVEAFLLSVLPDLHHCSLTVTNDVKEVAGLALCNCAIHNWTNFGEFENWRKNFAGGRSEGGHCRGLIMFYFFPLCTYIDKRGGGDGEKVSPKIIVKFNKFLKIFFCPTDLRDDSLVLFVAFFFHSIREDDSFFLAEGVEQGNGVEENFQFVNLVLSSLLDVRAEHRPLQHPYNAVVQGSHGSCTSHVIPVLYNRNRKKQLDEKFGKW